jgi:putative Mg2+ transporter-C (MgtC) family protein
MPFMPDWRDLSIRLALAIVAGLLTGLNRSEYGHPVGLRTTLLVCVAAAVAMIQVNLLLNTTGKTTDSFITNDLMRLPLGILSGMGFIGAGAILRRGKTVQGVTTAATLWIVTVIGLCLGGGQIVLGLAALGITLATLAGLKVLEARLKQRHHAMLTVTFEDKPTLRQIIMDGLATEGFKPLIQTVKAAAEGDRLPIFSVSWWAPGEDRRTPDCLDVLAKTDGVRVIEWTLGGAPPF